MIEAVKRYYCELFAVMTLLGGGVTLTFTLAGEISKSLGVPLSALLLAAGALLVSLLLIDTIERLRLKLHGEIVQGHIESIRSNALLNLPVVIHFSYEVQGKKYYGRAATSNLSSELVPKAGSSCQVVYDKRNPSKAIVEYLLA